MTIYFDPLDRLCKSRTGAISRSTEITFQVFRDECGEGNFSADCCTFVFCRDGEMPTEFPMQRTENGWKISLRIHREGLYFYHFRLDYKYLSRGRLGIGEINDFPASFQLTVYAEEFQTPDWMKGGIMYQIFPDRFCKQGDIPAGEGKELRSDWGGTPHYRPNECGKVLNNDFFGGNLNGIRSKLGYLKRLNVSVLYLNPIFEAFSNHRYDTGDYRKVDPLLGTEADLDLLISEAKACGIRIILDGVFNHTGDDSRYFNKYGRYDSVGAYQSQQSPYADWYHFHPFPDVYDSWWGITTLPAVNEASPSYQEFLFGEDGVIRHWLSRGIAGYRLDVADELPDFFLEKLRTAVKTENADALVLGEVWEDASNKIAYNTRRKYFLGRELDSVMNYPLKDAIISAVSSEKVRPLRETMATLVDHYPKQVLDCLMNILGTHDTARILTVFGGKICMGKDEMAVTYLTEEERARAESKVRTAALLLYTMPGVPCIYYGDENGAEGYGDPFCRRCFDWQHTDHALLDHYELLGRLRSGVLSDLLKDGDYREIFGDHSCLVYERRKGKDAVYVFVNFSTLEYRIPLREPYRELLSDTLHDGVFHIPRQSCGILLKEKYYVTHSTKKGSARKKEK